jgi:multiple sugar transport system permease protein
VTQATPAALAATAGSAGRGTAPGRRRRRRLSPAYAFLLPGLAVLVLVMVYPAVQAATMSLEKWSVSPKVPSTFVGLANYARALGDPVFWRSMANAGIYLLGTVPPQVLLGLLCAVALNAAFRGRTAFRVMIYIPVITSWVVVSILFKYLFATDGGLMNWLLVDVTGAVSRNIDWFNGRWTAMLVICLLGTWKGVGWAMLIFLAALQSVPRELYEAAEMDGAGWMRRFWHVTIPGIRRTLSFVTILLVIGAFNVFISVRLITDGGPAGLTEVPLTYLYRQAFSNLDFGYGSAIAFLLTAVVFAFSAAQYWLGRRGAEEAAA